jgi:hypothetical protein
MEEEKYPIDLQIVTGNENLPPTVELEIEEIEVKGDEAGFFEPAAHIIESADDAPTEISENLFELDDDDFEEVPSSDFKFTPG